MCKFDEIVAAYINDTDYTDSIAILSAHGDDALVTF